MKDRFATLEAMNAVGRDQLPGHLGIRFTHGEKGLLEAEIALKTHHLGPNGYLHAGTLVTLADSACGYGCMLALPEGAAGFTTIELKTNFLATTLDGVIAVRAEARHLGRTTQLWDAEVRHRETSKTLALFRCTQMVLWPRD